MGWKSFGVVGFDLGPLLQGQTRIAKVKSGGGIVLQKSKPVTGALKRNKIRYFVCLFCTLKIIHRRT